MKNKFLSIALFLIFSTNVIAHSEHYKDINVLEYELFRNNQSIGYHNYKFEKKGNLLNVTSLMNFKITKLGLDLYSYTGTTEEEYQENQLIDLNIEGPAGIYLVSLESGDTKSVTRLIKE